MAQDIKDSGLNFWSGQSSPETPYEVDIIAVQGLGANPFYTWVRNVPIQETKETTAPKRFSRSFWKKNTAQGKDAEHTKVIMWPRDLLVPVFRNARIATYSYKSSWKDRLVHTSLRECGQQLLEVLLQHRQNVNERRRPLVLIGHSLGGLVIQQALVIAAHGPNYIDLRLSVAGIIFLGTPFQGSDEAAYAQWLAKLVRLQQGEGLKYTLLKTLQKDSPSLHALSIDFWRSYGEYDITCFYENTKGEHGPLHVQLVSTQSATLIGKRLLYMNTDHSGLNKFSGNDDENFALLLPEIRRMVKNSPLVVADRYRKTDASPPGNVHWMVPSAVNSLFTGRSELINRIQSAFRVDDNRSTAEQKRLVITGIGGQGKSEICLKVVNLMREDFWGVFWVDVGSPSTAKNGFLAVAKALGSLTNTINESLQALTNTKGPWLLVLDNADDPMFDYAAYIPSGTRGAVLMTSRIPQCNRYSTVESEALEGLDLEHSTQLLLKAAKLPPESWPSCKRLGEDVVHLLGSHTLALIQAGAYIAEGFCRLDQYPQRYQQQRKRLLEHYPEQEQSRYRDVYATFEASADVLQHLKSDASTDALELLAILSMFHSSVLPLQVFGDAWEGARQVLQATISEKDKIGALDRQHVPWLPELIGMQADKWDDYRLKKASALLASLSLVTRHHTGDLDGLSMHPLAHAWAKDRLEYEQQQQAWVSAGCLLALSREQSQMWQVPDKELRPHVQFYLSPIFDADCSYEPRKLILPIILRCGWILHFMREDAKLELLLDSLFRELGIMPSDPSEEYLLIWDLAAGNLINMGNASQAVNLLEHVINVRKTTLVKTHPDLLTSQNTLASAYMNSGQTKEAVTLLEHVVRVRETTLVETHPSRLTSQHELARAYMNSGQTKEAVALLEHVVKVEETTLVETHPSRLTSQHELARAYMNSGQTKEAVALLEHVVRVHETTLVETHPSRLTSQHALARAYMNSGQTKEAVTLLEHVVKVEETTLVETHPSRLSSQHALACAYMDSGQTKEAVTLQEHVVRVHETTLVETHPDRRSSERMLSHILLKAKQSSAISP